MISQLLNILELNKFYGNSHNIDIAKGRYELPSNWKSTKDLIKRIWYGRKSKN